MRVVVGTRNPAKVRELAAALAGIAVVEAAPCDISLEGYTEIERLNPNPTVDSIAAAKATAWSRALLDGGERNVPVVASDGGLLIPALGAGEGWNPLRTRRFAGEAASDRERAEALLALTTDLEGEERRIGWREAVAVARDGDLVATFVAEGPPGLLARDFDPALVESGEGFWVPALWICPEVGGKRLAELTDDERGLRADHWRQLGRALRACLSAL